MNPEFRRNLWLELTPHRLVAMPVVLGLIFVAAYQVNHAEGLADAARAALGVLLVLWGSRLAADAVLGEVAGRTWDGQRLSAIAPWPMTWGKLLGSTAYVWYGALCCLLALALAHAGLPDAGPLHAGPYARLQAEPLTALGTSLAVTLLSGLLAQAVALLVTLLTLRGRPASIRFQVTLAQMLGIMASLPFQGGLWPGDVVDVSWYGRAMPASWFLLGTLAVFTGWAVAGIHQLMRSELQVQGHSWAWPGFVLFVAAFAGGFQSGPDTDVLTGNDGVARLLLAFAAAVALTYVAAFVEPKSPVRLRQWRCALHRRDLRPAVMLAPDWLVPGVMALILAGAAALSGDGALAPFLAAILAFLVRDIALIYWVTLGGPSRRGHLAAVVYLVLLYLVMPFILTTAGQGEWAAVLVPAPEMGRFSLVAGLVQAVAVLVAAWRRTVTGSPGPAHAASNTETV